MTTLRQAVVGIEEIAFGSIAQVESGPNFLAVLKSRAIPALVNGVLAEIRQRLAPECISLPLETTGSNTVESLAFLDFFDLVQ
jgi:hypothetical protein